VVAPGTYWIEAPDGAESPRYELEPVDELLLAELRLEVIYPPYLGRANDHYEGEVPPREVPAGTVLRIAGQSTRPLSAAALQGASGVVPLSVTGRSFEANWRPRQTGQYGWILQDSAGNGPAVAPPPLEISVLADRPRRRSATFPAWIRCSRPICGNRLPPTHRTITP
jgi:hypothetical protein